MLFFRHEEDHLLPVNTFHKFLLCSHNQTLEKAGRVADFIELGQLMCLDAIDREESCGAHARLEYLAESGDAKRDDENYSHVAAWEFQGGTSVLHKEHLHFEFIKPSVRDYK